jgi:hypothetical protein
MAPLRDLGEVTTTRSDNRVLATIAAILTIPGPPNLDLLTRALTTLGISGPAATVAIHLYTTEIQVPMPEGAAGQIVERGEIDYRAAFLLASAQRIQAALTAGQTMSEAVTAEQRYWAQHKAAVLHRAMAARQVDRAARMYGNTLGWYLDTGLRTHTPACVAAAGHNFDPTRRPLIGFPGTSHALCGCYAGPAHDTTRTVDDATRALVAAGMD